MKKSDNLNVNRELRFIYAYYIVINSSISVTKVFELPYSNKSLGLNLLDLI